MALRTVGVRLTAEVGQYMANLRRAGESTRGLKGEMEKAAASGHLDAIADRATFVGGALVGMAGYAVKAGMDFDKSMSAVSAATNASAKDIDKLREAALEAGKSTQYSATEAAQGITELGKAGVGTADILNGGLKGALSLAAAGQLDVGKAAELSASAMTQFKLKGDQVPHVADLMAAAAGKAQGSVEDMGMALNQTGLVAAQTGLSIEETTGGLAAFASAGLTGSDAGTSFKQMLLMLQAPSDKTKALMDDLGISAYDAQGNFIGLANLAEQLKTKMQNLTPEVRANAMAQIFGADATRAASILYEEGAAGITEWTNKVNDSGYASETAAKLTDNLAGDLERLKGSVETLAIEAGSGANGGLRVLAQAANSLVDAFASLPSGVSTAMTVLAGVGGLAVLGGGLWLKGRQGARAFREELSSLGPAGEKAADGMNKVSVAASRAGAALAGLQIAKMAVASFQTELKPQVDALASGLEEFARSGKLAGESSRVLGGNLDDLAYGFEFLADGGFKANTVELLQGSLESLIPGLAGTNTSLARTKERIVALDASLAQMAGSGKTAEAAAAFKRLGDTLAVNGVSMEEFKAQFPQYAAAVEVASKQTKGMTGATKDSAAAAAEAEKATKEFATAQDAAAAAAKGHREALVDLSNKMAAEANPAFALIDAQDSLAKAQKEAAKATKEHGAKSVEARAANRDLAKAAIDLQEKVGALGSGFSGQLTPAMEQTLRAAGLNEKQIKEVSKQFRDAKKAGDDYAKEYKAPSSAPGAKQAKTDLDKARIAAENFQGPYQAKVSVVGDSTAEEKLRRLNTYQAALKRGVAFEDAALQANGGKLRFAEGGAVRGPGTATSDSIPAWLSNDEHVWTAAEVAKLGGHQAMLALRGAVRSGKRVEWGDDAPGFARGGPVGWPYPTTAAGTRIPSAKEAAGAVVPDVPGGGATSSWIVAVARAMVPGIRVISKDRPGARTLSGNRSYHSMGRAVDFEPSEKLARLWNERYKARTKELISPYQQYNIHNGSRHRYTGRIWNQHNFAGGNAHDHIAMANGGTITEPIYGVGASGRTYSFGENYQPERVVPNWQGAGGGGGGTTTVTLNVSVAAGASPVEAGRQIAQALQPYLAAGGQVVVRGRTVLAAS